MAHLRPVSLAIMARWLVALVAAADILLHDVVDRCIAIAHKYLGRGMATGPRFNRQVSREW